MAEKWANLSNRAANKRIGKATSGGATSTPTGTLKKGSLSFRCTKKTPQKWFLTHPDSLSSLMEGRVQRRILKYKIPNWKEQKTSFFFIYHSYIYQPLYLSDDHPHRLKKIVGYLGSYPLTQKCLWWYSLPRMPTCWTWNLPQTSHRESPKLPFSLTWNFCAPLESAGFQRHTLTFPVFWATIPHKLMERTIHAQSCCWSLKLLLCSWSFLTPWSCCECPDKTPDTQISCCGAHPGVFWRNYYIPIANQHPRVAAKH
jgi:hypothetical protein